MIIEELFQDIVLDDINLSLSELKQIIKEEILKETIVKKGSKFCLVSKKKHKNLGCYPSRSGAEKRERQVQYFKHLKGE